MIQVRIWDQAQMRSVRFPISALLLLHLRWLGVLGELLCFWQDEIDLRLLTSQFEDADVLDCLPGFSGFETSV
jgi:hypothetical protein